MARKPADEKLGRLKRDMERLRAELYRALDRARGNHLDASVQKLSRDFDRVLSAYMRIATRGAPKKERERHAPSLQPQAPKSKL